MGPEGPLGPVGPQGPIGPAGPTQWTVEEVYGNIYYNGNVGIGRNDPQFTLDVSGIFNMLGNSYLNGNVAVTKGLHVDGNLYVTGTASYINVLTTGTLNGVSDYRIKENVVSLDKTVVVDSLKPIYYVNKITNSHDFGFIAHEVQEHFPSLVTGEKDGEKLQSINYTGFISILVKEIQELKERVLSLENKNM